MSAGFARLPAGADPYKVAARIAVQQQRLQELRHELGEVKAFTGELAGRSLVELDLLRALTALGAAGLALERARRHAELEP